jgi:hypothetical protein
MTLKSYFLSQRLPVFHLTIGPEKFLDGKPVATVTIKVTCKGTE